ncbi:hypothetical protein [Streptomyces sp. NPDC057554]|uniref:hypothetical protein n=1 Tax=Streptomyces sp. NPDC057554 TaxID=3350538 RepID=UPI0036BCE5FC
MTATRVVLEGGPRHGEEYTVTDSLDHLEMPTKRLSVGEILFGPELATVFYRRSVRDRTVFEYQES